MSKLRQRLAESAEQEYDTTAALESIDDVRTALFKAYDTIVEAQDFLTRDAEQLLNEKGQISSYHLVDKLSRMQMLISDINEKLGNSLE